MKVAVIGSGSWGTALALKALKAGNDTALYCRREEHALTMRESRENEEYLPGVRLPEELNISADLEDTLKGANIVLLVTPSKHVRHTLESMKEFLAPTMIVVACSKGLDRNSGQMMTEVIEDVVGTRIKGVAVLSGPNHAEEISRDLPAATVVSATASAVAEEVQKALHSPTFRVYINEDPIGVQLAGTTKNIVALAAGIADGMQLGDNLKAALLTRGLHEMTKFGIALGAKKETYAGLAGMGDLIATCMSPHSRNRSAGQKLANGESMDYIIHHSHMVVEGFFAAQTVYEKALELNVEMPITEALYSILYKGKHPQEALIELMDRDLKNETHMM